MSVHLEIPESIAASLRVPAPEMESRLRAELAVALYGQGILSFGKAAELATYIVEKGKPALELAE